MSDSEERAPLLWGNSMAKQPAHQVEPSSESTPLLTGGASTPRYDGEQDHSDGDEAAIRSQLAESISSRSLNGKKTRRWPSIIAMALLALISVAIIVLSFFVPAAVEEYAKQAAVLEPTNLSLESITSGGVRARIQANFRLDGQRVENEHVRRVGRAVTWLVGGLGTEEMVARVYLPAYDNVMIGAATLPPLAINLADGRITSLDFVADLAPGDADGIRAIANEWLEGRLDVLKVQAKADIQLKTGIIPLGTHAISESLTFEAKRLPAVPQYNITKLKFHDTPVPGEDNKAVGAEVSISAFNEYPVSVDIPVLGFEILVPGCVAKDPYIVVAEAKTSPLAVRPHQKVEAEVHGLIRDIPESLTRVCPNSNSSPLDIFLKDYMVGKEATLFVRGQSSPDSSTPRWLADILSSVIVPVPFPGRTFDNLIKNLSMTDVHLTMPDPSAEPGDPGADPKVSGTILVIAALPPGLNFDLNVTKVKANADVFHGSKKLGTLNLREWQDANSTRTDAAEDGPAMLQIQSRINDVPLNITDGDVLTEVIQKLLLGSKVVLKITALVHVKVETVLGELVLKDVPASGSIPVKPLPNGSIADLNPRVTNLEIFDTAPSYLKLRGVVNITNPTPYTATVPFFTIHVMCNGSVIGEATARNLNVTKGNNTNIQVLATWSPLMGGEEGAHCGRNLLSGYVSGFNTSLAVRAHRDSIPGQPVIGEALSRLNITLAAPRLRLPGSDEEKFHFIRDATFHIFSSTATFTLVSPLQHNTIFIDHVNATAYYNHTEPVGRIEYDSAIAAPPGESQTPKMPVDWSLDSVGYDKLRSALGGRLKLDAKAVVGVRLGAWTETIWYIGEGIGAGVRV